MAGQWDDAATDPRRQVLDAATTRADALAAGDPVRLRDLLHADFRWTSHTGANFDRNSYIAANTSGATLWRGQALGDPEVIVVDDVAVLRTVVQDEIQTPRGPETFRMPMTQVWVRSEDAWTCLAGHAGPRMVGSTPRPAPARPAGTPSSP